VTLLVVGLSHHSAPVAVLERISIAADDVAKVMDELQRSESISEVMVLSTCNRIEVYADVDRFHPAVADISGVLARAAGAGVLGLGEYLYVHFAEGATEHLFQVASGLDSMVVGESQILGQLRSAYAFGTEAGTVGRVLHDAVQNAIRIGKRVHSETGIDRAAPSVVSVALIQAAGMLAEAAGEAVETTPDSWAGKRVLILGAGSMGALAGATLRRVSNPEAAPEIVVINRSFERAQRLAAGLHGRPAPLEHLAAELAAADVLVSSTGATGIVLAPEHVTARDGRSLIILDLAMPRDVDPAVVALPDIRYIDLEVLRSSGAMVSDAEIRNATGVVASELHDFLRAQHALAVAPTVTALRARAAQVVDAELLRLDARLPGLAPEVRSELASAVRRAVDKVLHAPTVRVKELAATPEGDSYAAALRTLFDLDPSAAGSVAAVRTADNFADDSRLGDGVAGDVC
jgi:glutamyl-tRNA reductase